MKTPVEKVKEYKRKEDEKYQNKRERCFRRVYRKVLRALSRRNSLYIYSFPYMGAELENYLEHEMPGLSFHVSSSYHSNREHITWYIKKNNNEENKGDN